MNVSGPADGPAMVVDVTYAIDIDSDSDSDSDPRAESAAILAAAGFQPYVWDGWIYYGPQRTELDDCPAGGDSASMSSWRAPIGDETPDAYELPVTVWGDYCGSDLGRSNHGAILADYGPSVIDIRGDWSSHALYVPTSIDPDTAEELAEIGTALRDDYPIYSEEHHSAMEYEAAAEAWSEWVWFDLSRELESERGFEDVSELESVCREAFYTAAYDGGSDWPRFEDATSIVFGNWSDCVDAVAAELDRIGADRSRPDSDPE